MREGRRRACRRTRSRCRSALLSDVTLSWFPQAYSHGNRETILSILGYLRLGSSPQIIVWKRAAGGRRVKEDEDAGPKWAIVADTDAALGNSTTRSAHNRTGGIISVGTW
jgi:hypothetical protein